VTLAGCPLEEKISEMNLLKSEGFSIGALAMAAVDNPLVAATGHRICNDCMKACIYQKQEPVDIPQIETRTLKDVLGLPWGFEIYSLLTRWNPLDLRRPIPRPATGRTVLVVGLGPAGFNLAHHLMNDGHAVVGIDGLKIEPLPAAQSGVEANGTRVRFEPVKDSDSLREDLADRAMAGFGGVAEYGITVRWDKNYLKLVRLLLERRSQFSMFGGVRFGGTVTVEDAFAMGFDHVALCAGAGKPTVLDLPNGLARGVRAASDFLMALQLTGAAKKDSIANLQIRLPVVVIGGGLTAIDTATESLAYYPLQVEKFLARHETLVAERGEAAVCSSWNEDEREIAEEFIAHARAIREERTKAARQGREPDIAKLVNGWGGVTIAYRRRLIDSPSYTLNHEEVLKALEEDIRFRRGPVAGRRSRSTAMARPGRSRSPGSRAARRSRRPCRRIPSWLPAGTQPNTVLAREDATHAFIDGKYFRAVDDAGEPVTPERNRQAGRGARVDVSPRRRPLHVVLRRPASVLRGQRREGDGRRQAGLSGADGMPWKSSRRPRRSPQDILAEANKAWRATVVRVERLTPDDRRGGRRGAGRRARLRARPVLPPAELRGAFEKIDGTLLTMEGLALTWRLGRQGQGLAVADRARDGRLVRSLRTARARRAGDRHGPDRYADLRSSPARRSCWQAAGLGNAVLFSIGQAFRRAGSKVLYFAGYKRVIDRYKVEEIEAAADVVVYGAATRTRASSRHGPQDKAVVANIVEAMQSYACRRASASSRFRSTTPTG
jgi:NADPH-dependent glutamate synthase beta subunit-like oxidoreductase